MSTIEEELLLSCGNPFLVVTVLPEWAAFHPVGSTWVALCGVKWHSVGGQDLSLLNI